MSDTKNIFISHIHEDDEGLGKLKDLVGRAGMDVRDYSINSDKPNNAKDPDYIKTQILRPQIERCSVLVVYITPGTKDSEYVNWEIQEAERLGKRIVGVWEMGSSGYELPEALKDYGDACVGWNGNNIVDAINGNDTWTTASGEVGPKKDIIRHTCG